ncbi:MAG: DUF4279 domain-containing protein [Acidobacteriota bacterium]
MPPLHRSVATLRFWGDDLDPDWLSQVLGCKPTSSRTRTSTTVSTGITRTYKNWHLKAPDCEPEDLDYQVSELLGKLTQDLSVWAMLTERYHVDLFCGLFMEDSSEGVSISVDTLLALGKRGIKLGLDIYAPDQITK